jgi:D-alanyl-D-alanine-carboxypeptidase/D-alanyl-D-alanine-endopeptidase
LLPPGVTVPTRDKVAITLQHLATHTSGLPRLPPSLIPRAAEPDPYAGYGEDALYQDLIHTQLEVAPGTRVEYSNYGVGLLGVALGRKIGGGYAAAIKTRVLEPLGLRDTFVSVPASLEPRRAQGTTDDLQPTPPWTFDAIAGAGALISTARDQLKLIDAELDAAAGSRAVLRAPMRLTQERIDEGGRTAGLGWVIDGSDRFWHNGGTGGFHSFVGFDPKTRRGIVILASSSTTLIDRLADALYQVLEGTPPVPTAFPTAEAIASFAGSYDLAGIKLQVIADGKRLYVEGQGEPRRRMLPISDHEFLIEAIQALAVFEKDGDKVARLVFVIGKQHITAPRVN